ncbi:hypothetical protein LTR86_006579 [Recurvomyces mirabilis]|nr:hypothetical protein LTR86_006579 [Recurvomyces mirabilis]
MSSSQYSAGSEEGEIRPTKKIRRTVDPTMPTAIRTGTSGSHARHTPAPRPSNRRASPDTMRPPPPPGPLSPSTTGSKRTLFQELQSAASRPPPTSAPAPSTLTTAVPAFPGWENRGSSSKNPVDRHEHVPQPRKPGAGAVGPPPSANMITASQEQRGITHGTQPEFDEVRVAVPARRNEAANDHGRVATATTSANNASKDPYQVQVEVIEEHQDLADSSYEPSQSQDTPPPFTGSIDTQETVDLASADVDARRGLPSDTATITDYDQPASARRPNECEDCATSLDDEPYTWKCTRCEHSGFCVACYAVPQIVDRNGHHDHKFVSVRARASQGAAGPSASTASTPREQVIEKQRKKMVKLKYGVRHMPYTSLKQESARQDRDRAIRQIRLNWPGSTFWPRALAPRSNGILLHPRDVSTSLLSVVLELSDLTKWDPQTGHDAMTSAVSERQALQSIPDGHVKLLPDDVKVAIELCSGAGEAMVRDEDSLTIEETHVDSETESESLDIVPSQDIAVRPRARMSSEDTANDTFDTSVTFRQSPSTPSHQLDDEMDVVPEEGAQIQSTVPSSIAEDEAPRPRSFTATSEEHRTITPAKQQPLGSPVVTLADLMAQAREIVRTTPSSREFRIAREEKWSDHVKEFEDLFVCMSTKAEFQGKILGVRFQLEEE